MENMYNDIADLGLPMICAGGIGSEVELKKAINLDSRNKEYFCITCDI